MKLNLNKVPFSRYGSYMVIFKDNTSNDLYIRSVHGDSGEYKNFLIEFIKNGEKLEYTEITMAGNIRVDFDGGYAEICISGEKVIRMRAFGCDIKLTFVGGEYVVLIPGEGSNWNINSSSAKIQYMLCPIKGRILTGLTDRSENAKVFAIFSGDASGLVECALEEFLSTWKGRDSFKDFDACVKEVNQEFTRWLDNTMKCSNEYVEARELAAYICWSSVVLPKGNLKRPTMLMSKNWMASVWSWDHCFNAMALAELNPEEAWNQFMIMFDVQDDFGCLPDSLNDTTITWNHCKPPVHGWALKFMMEKTDLIDNSKLKEIYDPLCKWTNWWFKYRDYDHDGIPQYNHGCDSGWDNASVFLTGCPVEAPDLSAYLVIQMDVLSEIALKLGKIEEANEWEKRSAVLLDALIKHCFNGKQFVAPISGSHKTYESDSLLLLLPIILGNKLPQNIQKELIYNLKDTNKYNTKYGFASESLSGLHYRANGYWLGSIWPVTIILIIDGLIKSGETDFASEVAIKFCNMCLKSGFAENYDAYTGNGQCDPSYTWSASIFLILANYLNTKEW